MHCMKTTFTLARFLKRIFNYVMKTHSCNLKLVNNDTSQFSTNCLQNIIYFYFQYAKTHIYLLKALMI